MDKKGERRRRDHIKSRGGCVNCKTRRIKCQETHPSCANCVRKQLVCLYRKPKKEVALLVVKEPDSGPQWPSSRFSMTDMQLFHHYLINASLALPSERTDVWNSELPSLAQQHNFLMHAFLTFGGTHLSTLKQSKDCAATIEHRSIALRGVSSAMQSLDISRAPDQSVCDAILATCMILQIQSAFLSDGYQDYLIMGRGIGLLMQRMNRHETIDEWQLRNLQAYVNRRIRTTDDGTVEFRKTQAAALASSLAILAPSCHTPEEKLFGGGMQDFCYNLRHPGFQPRGNVGSMWMYFASMSSESWIDFIDPSNLIAQKLLAHFFALLLLIRSTYPRINHGEIMRDALPALTDWVRQLSDNIEHLLETQNPEPQEIDLPELGLSDTDSDYFASTTPSTLASGSSAGFKSSFTPLQVADTVDYLGR